MVERCLTALVGCWNATGRVGYEKVVVEAKTGEVEVEREAAEVVHEIAEVDVVHDTADIEMRACAVETEA